MRDDFNRNEEQRLREEQRRVDAANQNAVIIRIIQVINYLTGALALLLLLRVLLLLFGANPNNEFARFIYNLSSVFIGPFDNLFGTPELGQQVFDINAIVAIAAYAILAWLLKRLIWLIGSRTR